MEKIREHLKLEPTDEIKQVGRRDKGHLGQTEIYSYEIFNAQGELICKAELSETQPVRPLTKSLQCHLVKKDTQGRSIEEFRWDGR
ncbi:hypothetical protein [Chromobacterium haemolyticum]|uniref:hypothetical protein n=1 Tax=Chromobacterium haemolyticum TaxID=394935 RepID=UPI0013194BBC|nr:hypothetical protein [Chromobacterium haemolyticum]BBH13388.1 hypothetical protein CH06BL_26360 [Chromobacterium haemolyticum]